MRPLFYLLLLTQFASCNNSNVSINLTENLGETEVLDVSINQAISESVGTCNFTATSDPTSSSGFSYRVLFSEAIDTGTFTTGDIANAGTGGGTTLTWSLTNCGDDTNFMLTATAVAGDGTIIPVLAASSVQNPSGNNNSISTAIDNSVTYSSAVTGWYQEAYIKAVNNGASDRLGWSVAIAGDTLAVGAIYEDSNLTTITNGATASSDNSNSDSGAVYVYKRTGVSWAQEAYIKAANNDVDDEFGSALSLSGDTLAVGVRYEDSNQITITNGTTASSDNTNGYSGAVYVYKRSGVNWAQEAYIKAANNNEDDYFGVSVSLSGDTLVVGAQGEDSNITTITNGTNTSSNNSNGSSGAVYVFKRTGVTWAQEAYIKATNNNTDDQFGVSVSFSGDTLVVGAHFEDSNETTITNGTTASSNNSNSASGAVYVYKRSGVTWAQEAYVKAPNNDASDAFGMSVSLSGDTFAVGVEGEDSNQATITNGATASGDNSNSSSGAVYVYKRTGVNWAQEAYIKAANNDEFDSFGYSVSLSGDTLVVGAYAEDSNQTTITNGAGASSDNSNTDSGAVYVYKRTGVTWAQEAYIKANNNNTNDSFGHNVSLSGDTLVVGAYFEDSNQTTITNGSGASGNNSRSASGAVYVYRNISRLFDVGDLFGIANSNSVTLSWNKSGGTASGYYVSYRTGSTAPVDCSSDIVINVMDVNTHTEFALSAGTTYSFRVCATDGVLFSPGSIFTITTAP